ncbi:MAG: fatty acid desaturase [Acidobacteriota bacterium]|nr:fatty acid desaturase [Acidobacteriota bacterium]
MLDRWLGAEDLRRWLHRSTAAALIRLALQVIAYLACVALALAPLPYALNLLSGVVAGHVIGILFTIGHDACHQAYTPSARLNRWIGRGVFIPSLHAESLWVLGHNKIHHGSTNRRGYDYVWEPMSPADYAAASPLRRWVYRVYRSRLGALPYYLIEMWWKKNFLPIAPEARRQWRMHVFDSAFVVVAGALHVWAIVAVARAWTPDRPVWMALLAAWLVPFLVWNWVMGLLIYAHHTHPLVPWFANAEEWNFLSAQVLGTVHVELPAPWRWIDNNIMEHNAHHALPAIPLYRLPPAQHRMRAAFPDIQAIYLSPPVFCRIADACKLFDFDARRWTDFEGRPTGPVLVARGSAAEGAVADAEDVVGIDAALGGLEGLQSGA